MSKKAAGESASVNKEETSAYVSDVLPGLLERYDANDIYNVDETGLFYKLLPDKTYTIKNEDCHGGKLSKERVTILLGANLTGNDKLKPLVIGKSKKPRCFNGINMSTLPVTYEANKKAWMTCDIFNEWLSNWNRKLQVQNRKVLLFIDNCPAHNLTGNFSNIEIQFLPPNTTSVLQPMDQGVINSFKSHYRRRLVNRYLAAIENRQDVNSIKINIREAIDMLTIAWRAVTSGTIANCFRKGGFVQGQRPAEQLENVQEMAEIAVDREIWIAVQENFDITTTFEEYVAADNSVSTTESITEEAIVQSVLASKFVKEEADGQEEDEEETEEKDDTPMNTVQCLEAIAGIRRFFQASNLPENVFDALTVLEDYALQQQITRKTKQTKITELFDNMIKKENN